MDSPLPIAEEETPYVPLCHDATSLFSTSDVEAHTIPVSALQAILRTVGQQQEGLLSLSDHFKQELCTAQASVGSLQALLREWEDEHPAAAAGAEPGGPGRVVHCPWRPEPRPPAAAAVSAQCVSRQPSVVLQDAPQSAGCLTRQASAELRSRRTSQHTVGSVCVLVEDAPGPQGTGSDKISNPGPGGHAALFAARTSKSDDYAAELPCRRENTHVSIATDDSYVAALPRRRESTPASTAADWGRRQSTPHSVATDRDSVPSVATSGFSSITGADDFERNAVYRLQARLGVYNTRGLVTAKILVEAVSALGIFKYTEDDMENLLRYMHDRTLTPSGHHSSLAAQCKKTALGRARTLAKLTRRGGNFSGDAWLEDDEPQSMRIKDFSSALMTAEAWCHDQGYLRDQLLVVKEVLFSGDANKLVAELTQVRVDELAAPIPKPDPMLFLEPIMGVVIFLNGISIGLQADASWLAGDHWFYVDLSFTLFFVLEVFVRIALTSCRVHFCGPDWAWNLFDTAIVLLSVMDSVMEAFIIPSQEKFDTSSFSVMRVARLTRLTRLFRIFRLKYMSELRLMVKGLLAGLRTLFWAIVLLVFTMYMIGVLLTMLYSTDPLVPSSIREDQLFATVPRSMFTTFRCFLGDCTTTDGSPWVLLMGRVFGGSFVFGYFACMMFVVFGIFNLVVAVYIENTIDAAKRNKDKDKNRRLRETLRIAHVTKRLLKKFCTARRKVDELVRSRTGEEVRRLLSCSEIDDVEDVKMEVSRELFLNVIQDPEVQWLMDDLEIPPDRADLFDILDSNGSGGIDAAELIQGLLRVRGDAKKSDVLASLLATRSLQASFKDFQTAALQQQELLLTRLGATPTPGGGRRRSSLLAQLQELAAGTGEPRRSHGEGRPRKPSR